MSRPTLVVADPLAISAEGATTQGLILPATAHLGWLPPWPERLAERGGPSLEAELADHVALASQGFLRPGSVVASGPGRLPFRHLLHLVVVDVFGDASVEQLATGIRKALDLGRELELARLWLPTFVVPAGVLDLDDFAWALRQAWCEGTGDRPEPGPDLEVAAANDEERRRVAEILLG